MPGWGRVVAGVVLGVAGTVYATNEEVRKNLPKAARDLPKNVQRRFESAVAAGREASTTRRQEILRDLETRGGSPAELVEPGEDRVRPVEAPAEAPAAEIPPADGTTAVEEPPLAGDSPLAGGSRAVGGEGETTEASRR